MHPVRTHRDTVEILTPAKLNLFLEVLGTRPDGFHELDMIMEAINLCDRLVVSKGGSTIQLETNVPDLPTGPENIVVRAAELFFRAAGLAPHVRCYLEKRIPVGGGLGGGSGNAVGTIYALMKLFDVYLSDNDLFAMALALGSDVPFFLRGGLARCRGRGERVDTLGAGQPRTFVLLAPSFALKTAEVYARLSFPLTSPRDLGTITLDIAEQKLRRGELLFNRLEEPAFALEPQLHEIREGARRGGVSVLLTGSGSCFFGLLQQEADVSQLAGFLECLREHVLVQLVRNLPPWWRPWRKEGGSANHRRTRSPSGEGK